MSTVIETVRKVTPPPPDNPWYYGYRDVYHNLPDGTTKYERIPLTLEDTLYPQEGDCIMESDLHERLLTYLATVFRWRTSADPGALILSDTGIYWDDPHLSFTHHCPDIAVIFGIKNRKVNYRSFSVGAEGVRPRLILELVSPNNRVNDVKSKVRDYHEVEIPMYVIADQKGWDDPWTLIGYRWRSDEYEKIPTDIHGRLWLEAVDLWLGVDGIRLVCYERDGKEIGDYTMIAKQLAAEKQRAEAETQRAEAEKQAREAAETKTKELEAELARLRAK
jgi:colicin import membrane protein